jgi:hypothetical protein
MPRKPKARPVGLPAIPAELLEQFGNGPMTARRKVDDSVLTTMSARRVMVRSARDRQSAASFSSSFRAA